MKSKRTNPAAAANGKAGGRPPKSLTDRAAFKGKVAIRINVETAVQLQSLMLCQTEGVHTPEQMVEWLIRQEAARRA